MKRYHTVTIYTSESKMSQLAKEYLRGNSIEYEEKNIIWNKKFAEELQEKVGNLDAPVTDIDGRLIIGYQPAVFDMLLLQKDKKKDGSSSYSSQES